VVFIQQFLTLLTLYIEIQFHLLWWRNLTKGLMWVLNEQHLTIVSEVAMGNCWKNRTKFFNTMIITLKRQMLIYPFLVTIETFLFRIKKINSKKCSNCQAKNLCSWTTLISSRIIHNNICLLKKYFPIKHSHYKTQTVHLQCACGIDGKGNNSFSMRQGLLMLPRLAWKNSRSSCLSLPRDRPHSKAVMNKSITKFLILH
jgi:hypothetical protein